MYYVYNCTSYVLCLKLLFYLLLVGVGSSGDQDYFSWRSSKKSLYLFKTLKTITILTCLFSYLFNFYIHYYNMYFYISIVPAQYLRIIIKYSDNF